MRRVILNSGIYRSLLSRHRAIINSYNSNDKLFTRHQSTSTTTTTTTATIGSNERFVSSSNLKLEATARQRQSTVLHNNNDGLDSNAAQNDSEHTIAHSSEIDSVKVFYEDRVIQLNFIDGSVINFNIIWLRDSCQCSQCVHPITKQKLVNCADISELVMIDQIEFDSDKDHMKIVWRDDQTEHISNYSVNWLKLFVDLFNPSAIINSGKTQQTPKVLPNDGIYAPNVSYPKQVYWDSSLFSANPEFIKIDYTQFMSDSSYLKQLIEYVCKFGVAFIENVPIEKNAILCVARRIAYERPTGYGVTFDVTFNPDPNTHLSYTGTKFDAHVDLAYRERSPGVQLLHCIEQASTGGQSFLVDGFACAHTLRQANATEFDALRNNSVLFSFCDAERGIWFREKWPIIKLEDDNSERIKEIHFSDFSMRAPILPSDSIDQFYRAYRNFTRIVRSVKSQYKFYMKPGDLIIFNNRRILHGRSEYDQYREKRYLQGCYMDLDEVVALYEKLNS